MRLFGVWNIIVAEILHLVTVDDECYNVSAFDLRTIFEAESYIALQQIYE
jgi:hypothetical protein